MPTLQETARSIPIVGTYDVLVCGAGPAGVAAALASARRGTYTGLMEVHGCLGGIWTAGVLSWILDHQDKGGIMQEILDRLGQLNARTIQEDGKPSNTYDVEVMKWLLEQMCLEANVDIYLHTRVVAAMKNPDGRLTHVISESRSGREAVTAKIFIDCTGDGDLGWLAGCSYDEGHPETGQTQPMSLMALVNGLDPARIRPFYRIEGEPWAPPKQRLRAEMERGGCSPSYSAPTLFHIQRDLFAMMANHEYGVIGTNARDVARATVHARDELHRIVAALHSLGEPWQKMHIVATGAQIGVREGRRLHGLYTVSAADLREGRRHHDAVCRVHFGIDVHSTDPGRQKGIEPKPFRSQPYDIPLRALISKDVPNLMMAGRCISGDFLAHSSYRVTGNAVALGEAAGRVASEAATSNRLPHEVEWSEVADG